MKRGAWMLARPPAWCTHVMDAARLPEPHHLC
jgi:hypothetical protein